LVNLSCAEGHPASVMDMSFANQALSAEYMVKNHESLSAGVYPVPADIDAEIARLKLASMGVKIDTLTADGDIWWEGMGDAPAGLTDWKGQPWTPESGTPAAHPNARFTAPAAQDPAIASEWEDPAGVPIDAILFGGRRASVIPLVFQSFDWEHGVFLGSTMASETTAAAAGAVGNLRRDPFAMLPFCGYNMADYFGHWLKMGAVANPETLPKIFYVNWFRKGDDGRWLWPGYGENSRVLEWVFERAAGRGEAVTTAIGYVPTASAINVEGLSVSDADLAELLTVNNDEWRREVPSIREHFATFAEHLPAALHAQVDALEQRLA
ncbi:MAG: phosphoenolpyruvate carboxykinase domain-containing protein, partial [Actinomycetota bacterium]